MRNKIKICKVIPLKDDRASYYFFCKQISLIKFHILNVNVFINFIKEHDLYESLRFIFEVTINLKI